MASFCGRFHAKPSLPPPSLLFRPAADHLFPSSLVLLFDFFFFFLLFFLSFWVLHFQVIASHNRAEILEAKKAAKSAAAAQRQAWAAGRAADKAARAAMLQSACDAAFARRSQEVARIAGRATDDCKKVRALDSPPFLDSLFSAPFRAKYWNHFFFFFSKVFQAIVRI